jgi:heme exporter protein B
LLTLCFFVLIALLFPLGIGPEARILRLIGPGIIWVSALLASLLALPHLFATDYQDGSLEHLLLAPQPLAWLTLSKIIAHWLITGLPLVLVAPILGLQYTLSDAGLWTLVATLLLGTPILSLFGAIGAALTLGLRSGGTLLALLVLPLYVPVLIFGAGAVEATTSGLGGQAHLSLLGGLLILALLGTPLATAAALRLAVE